MALTVALLAGQSHAFVLAEEGAGDVPQKEISSEGNQTAIQGIRAMALSKAAILTTVWTNRKSVSVEQRAQKMR